MTIETDNAVSWEIVCNAEGYLNIEKRKSKLIKMLLNHVYMHNT